MIELKYLNDPVRLDHGNSISDPFCNYNGIFNHFRTTVFFFKNDLLKSIADYVRPMPTPWETKQIRQAVIFSVFFVSPTSTWKLLLTSFYLLLPSSTMSFTRDSSFVPKSNVPFHVGKETVYVYPDLNPKMSSAEKSYGYMVTKSALEAIVGGTCEDL